MADEADSARLLAINRNIHPTILGSSRGAGVLRHRIVLAQSDQENLVRGHVVLLRQILNHGIGAALAELVVVVGRTGRIGVALNLHDVVLLALDLLRKIVQRLLVLAGELRPCQSRTARSCR